MLMKDCPKNLMITTLFKTLKMYNANAETLSFFIVPMYYVLCCVTTYFTPGYICFSNHTLCLFFWQIPF